MKKNIKYIIIVALLGVFIGVIGVLYTFFKPQRNIQKEKPAYIMQSINLSNDFSADEDSSYIKYSNKVIQVSGKVVEFNLESNGASVVFVNPIGGVTCSFDSITMANDFERISKIQTGDSLTLKGRCDGYDMIMGVVLSKCVLQ